jgi:hypothetical protein
MLPFVVLVVMIIAIWASRHFGNFKESDGALSMGISAGFPASLSDEKKSEEISSKNPHSNYIDAVVENSTALRSYDLCVTVVDYTPVEPEKRFTELAAARSDKDFELVLKKLIEPRPIGGVTVILSQKSILKREITNAQGDVEFKELPEGAYEIEVEPLVRTSWAKAEQMTQKKKTIHLHNYVHVNLEIRTDWVNVKGRVIDEDGKPVMGAEITGVPNRNSEDGPEFDVARAISDADGSFELNRVWPPDIYRIAGYLNGGAPDAMYLEIRATADGFKQSAPYKTPLITENLLPPARRLLEIFSKLNGGGELKEKENIAYPSSEGDAINGVTIVLNEAR